MKNKSKLKVFAGFIYVPSIRTRWRNQRRAIVACFSQKLAAELLGVSISEIRNYFSITSNPAEVNLALGSPLQPFVDSSYAMNSAKRAYIPLVHHRRWYTDSQIGKVFDISLEREIETVHFDLSVESFDTLRIYFDTLIIEAWKRDLDVDRYLPI